MTTILHERGRGRHGRGGRLQREGVKGRKGGAAQRLAFAGGWSPSWGGQPLDLQSYTAAAHAVSTQCPALGCLNPCAQLTLRILSEFYTPLLSSSARSTLTHLGQPTLTHLITRGSTSLTTQPTFYPHPPPPNPPQNGCLVLGGADIVDGSPVLDIKPYVPFCDCLAAATAPAWVQVRKGGGEEGVMRGGVVWGVGWGVSLMSVAVLFGKTWLQA